MQTDRNQALFFEEFLEYLPHELKIHTLGDFNLHMPHREIIKHGFIDVYKFLKNNNFLLCFSRGGFSTLDMIAFDIPTIAVYTRPPASLKYKQYMTSITANNFTKMWEQNFVSFDEFNLLNFVNIWNDIKYNYDSFKCSRYLNYEKYVNKYKTLIENL